MNILKTEKPQTIANILNGKQAILVMKKAPKNAEGRWWYLYCSKSKPYLFYDIWAEKSGNGNLYYCDNKEHDNWSRKLNGKVVARFTLKHIDNLSNHFTTPYLYIKETCLTWEEILNYQNNGLCYAIHISKLEIFDRPKELSEFHTVNKYGIPQYQFGKGTCDYKKLTKAPQNYCYVEGE